MKYLLISMLVLLTSCSEFETLMQHQGTQGVPDQLTCTPSGSSGCIGFKIEEEF